MTFVIMSVVIRGSAGRYFDNNYYQKDDEQALIQSKKLKNSKNQKLKIMSKFVYVMRR